MQTDNLTTNTFTKHLRVEDGPPYGKGALSFQDDLLYSALAHLFAIVIWPWKRGASAAVDAHGKEALNMAITGLIALLPLSFVLGFLPAYLARILGVVVALLGLAALALAIYGLILARQGKLLRYPFNFRLLK